MLMASRSDATAQLRNVRTASDLVSNVQVMTAKMRIRHARSEYCPQKQSTEPRALRNVELVLVRLAALPNTAAPRHALVAEDALLASSNAYTAPSMNSQLWIQVVTNLKSQKAFHQNKMFS